MADTAHGTSLKWLTKSTISYEATTFIDAPPEAVWAVMTDGATYTAWDSGITLPDGEVEGGPLAL